MGFKTQLVNLQSDEPLHIDAGSQATIKAAIANQGSIDLFIRNSSQQTKHYIFSIRETDAKGTLLEETGITTGTTGDEEQTLQKLPNVYPK